MPAAAGRRQNPCAALAATTGLRIACVLGNTENDKERRAAGNGQGHATDDTADPAIVTAGTDASKAAPNRPAASRIGRPAQPAEISARGRVVSVSPPDSVTETSSSIRTPPTPGR